LGAEVGWVRCGLGAFGKLGGVCGFKFRGHDFDGAPSKRSIAYVMACAGWGLGFNVAIIGIVLPVVVVATVISSRAAVLQMLMG